MKRTSLNTVVQLTDKQKRMIEDEITAFYLDVRGEETGIIEKQQILDLFIENLAPIVYNKVLDDVKKWYLQKQEEMNCDYYSLYKDE